MKKSAPKTIVAGDSAARQELCQARSSAVKEAIAGQLRALGAGERADAVRDRVESILRRLSVVDGEVPVRRLGSCAQVDDEPCLALEATALQRRQGWFPYHVRGSETALLDDWTMGGPYVLVAACDNVKTRKGGLVVLRGEGPASCSPLFHAVVPAVPEDVGYLYGFLRTVDAGRLIVGPDVLRRVPLASLRALAVPWPDFCLRTLVTDVFEEAWSAEESLPSAGVAGQGPVVGRVASQTPRPATATEALLSLPGLLMALLGLAARGSGHRNAACCPVREPRENLVGGKGSVACVGMAQVRDGCLPGGIRDGASQPLPHEPVLSGEEAILALLGTFFDGSDCSRPPVDVVAETQDLAHAGVGRTSSHALCVPGVTESVWCASAVNRADSRWVWGVPPRNRSDYAWLQQTFSCLDEGGVGAVVMRNAPLYSSVGADPGLRAAMAASGQVRCVVSLPPRLFGSNGFPQSLIVLQRGDPRSSALFVDLQDRGIETGGPRCAQRISRGEIDRVIRSCRSWMREDFDPWVPGPWRAVSFRTVEEAGGTLAPWAYVGRDDV